MKKDKDYFIENETLTFTKPTTTLTDYELTHLNNEMNNHIRNQERFKESLLNLKDYLKNYIPKETDEMYVLAQVLENYEARVDGKWYVLFCRDENKIVIKAEQQGELWLYEKGSLKVKKLPYDKIVSYIKGENK